MTLVFRGSWGPCEKSWRDRLLYATIFKRVLDITGIKIRQNHRRPKLTIREIDRINDLCKRMSDLCKRIEWDVTT